MISLIAVDPLLEGGLLWTPLFIVLLKVLIVFVVGLVATMLMVWFERKVIAGMQNRVGPNKAGPWGLLQTLADGTKLFFKEDLLPERSDRLVFRLAPYLALVPAFLAFAIIRPGHIVRARNAFAIGRPTNWCAVRVGYLVNCCLRNHARWLVKWFEVPVAGFSSCVSTNGVL